MTTGVLVSLAEVSVVAKGRKSVADVEAEAKLYGLTLLETWKGELALSAQQAKDYVDGTAKAVYEHEQRQRRYQEATAEWTRRQVAAGVAASEKKRAEHQAAGRVADGESWSRQSAAATAAYAKFEKTEPKPRLE